MIYARPPSSVMVLRVVSSEGYAMPPHFLQKGFRVNAAGYIRVLEAYFEPWIDQVANGRPYPVRQDSALAHKAEVTHGRG